MMFRSATSIFALAMATVIALPAFAPSVREDYTPVSNDMILDPPPGDWLMWRRTIDNQAFSPLDQINTDTVANLELA